jgi:DNA-binding NtrC family response regulator
MQTVLVIHSQSEIVGTIKNHLAATYQVTVTTTYESGLKLFEKNRFDFTFIDVVLFPKPSEKAVIKGYRDELRKFFKIFPTASIIVLSTQQQIRSAVQLVKAGASDYLTTPLIETELKLILENTHESTLIQHELDYLRDNSWQDDSLDIVRTNNEEMKKIFEKIRYVAETKTTVLLTGETGVGKGVIAKLIHRHSDRSDNPFIHVHCGAITDNLVESELFGHEKGSFTGAIKRKLGRFEIAANGTVFLDELGTITTSTQIKLLQVLQDKVFQRVGGEMDIQSNARVIAATNLDLEKLVESGEFRSDLYYRLNVFPIEILPLRKRPEDIPLLLSFFLDKLKSTYPKEISEVHPQVIEALQQYNWPGNIRELENVIERAYILERSSILTPESFPQEMFGLDQPKAKVVLDTAQTLAETRQQSIEQVERQYLKEQMSIHNGRINKTAEAAGISTRQLHKLLTKYKILKGEFRIPNLK